MQSEQPNEKVLQVTPTSTSNRVVLQCEVAACLVGFPQVTTPAVGTTWRTRSCNKENSDAPIAFKVYNTMQHLDGFVSSENNSHHSWCRTATRCNTPCRPTMRVLMQIH